jgi:uncharacterized membrane protein
MTRNYLRLLTIPAARNHLWTTIFGLNARWGQLLIAEERTDPEAVAALAALAAAPVQSSTAQVQVAQVQLAQVQVAAVHTPPAVHTLPAVHTQRNTPAADPRTSAAPRADVVRRELPTGKPIPECQQVVAA